MGLVFVAVVLSVLLEGGAERPLAEVLDDPEMEDQREAIEQILSHANESCMQTFSCCSGSSLTLSKKMWQHVKEWAPLYHIREIVDSTPRMLERHYTFYNMYKRIRATDASQLWASDCYFGLVGIILNALPAVEFEEGQTAALGMLNQARHMLSLNSNMTEANWSMPTEPLEIVLPFFLGARPNDCFGSSLKVFVYETGKYSAGTLFCSAGQWGVEAAIHMFFAASSCRTLNPEEADLFLVPDYRACHYHLAPTYQQKGLNLIPGDDYHSAIIHNHRSKYRDAAQADKLFRDLVGSLEYFDRRHGVDHIFIFSDQGFIVNFTHTFPSWRDVINPSIIMTTEAFTPGCGPSCFSPWKDIVIPGHLDRDRMNMIHNWSLPSSKRTYLFNFHGRLPVNHDYYQNNTVRRAILKFADLPDVSIGGFVEDYFQIMGSSHFCLVPEGTSSWTNHLYESFFAGCIPFILSDRYVLPFQDLIDWKSLSIRWPQDSVGKEMYAYLRDLVDNRMPVVEEMKRRLEDAACWFDFYRFDGDCSPYRAMVHDLEKRKAAMPRYLENPPIWLP